MQAVIYPSLNDGMYFFVDEKSSKELNKYIQIRSAIDTRIALIVRKEEVKKASPEQEDYINRLLKRPKKQQKKDFNFKKKKDGPRAGSGHYGREVKQFMNKYKCSQRDLTEASGYVSQSFIQKFIYNPDVEILNQSWARIEKGMNKIISQSK